MPTEEHQIKEHQTNNHQPSDHQKLDFRFRSLLYLQEIVNSGTQSEAADNLDISQPALSQTIDSLEESWDIQIFERNGKERILTEAGKILVDFTREITGKTLELKAWLESLNGGTSGTLSIGMIDSANLHILPEALENFSAIHPQVELHLLVAPSTTLAKKLKDFELDLAFVTHSSDLDLDFSVVEVAKQDLFMYVPKSLDPKIAPWALYPPGSKTRQLIDEALLREGVTPNVIMESNNPQILGQMVKLGFCCAVLAQADTDGKISSLKSHKITERKLVAITRKTSPRDVRIQNLISMAQKL